MMYHILTDSEYDEVTYKIKKLKEEKEKFNTESLRETFVHFFKSRINERVKNSTDINEIVKLQEIKERVNFDLRVPDDEKLRNYMQQINIVLDKLIDEKLNGFNNTK